MIGYVNGMSVPPVMSLYPQREDVFYEAAGTYEFVIPKGAKRIDVTCIGGGGGGHEGGVSYGSLANAWPGGGGSGGTGEIRHIMGQSVKAGEKYSVTVGKGGSAYGGAGETSAFGEMLNAAGGTGGARGGNEPLSNTATTNGGAGGKGGIGGNGGGPGRGQYSHQPGASGANGESVQAWKTWEKNEWYAFRDESTGKRLGVSARGGYGYDLGSYGGQYAQGLSAADGPGEMFGGSGQGGDQKKTGTSQKPGAGAAGLVAVRVWYK